MSKEFNRRELIGRAAGIGFGVTSVLKGQAAVAQATAKAASNNFPQAPNLKTELRELAPNVFAYIQGGGPGSLNAGVSNAGLIVADNHVMVIDSLGAPLHAKAFLAAIQKTAPNKPIRLNPDHPSSRRPHLGFAFLSADCRVLCHPDCRGTMLETPVPSPVWEKREGWAEGGEPRGIFRAANNDVHRHDHVLLFQDAGATDF